MLHHTFIPAEDGNTETIVLLHGFGGNSRIWKYQIPLLSKYYNVLTIDLPSHNEGNLRLSELDVTLDSDGSGFGTEHAATDGAEDTAHTAAEQGSTEA